MSTDLDRTLTRLYDALGTEAQYAPLPAPEALRRRGDRRTVARTTLAVAAAAVLVAGVAAGGNQFFGGDSTVVPAPPIPTPSPTATSTAVISLLPSPTGTGAATAPPSSPTTAKADPPPTSIPDSVFLSGVEINDSGPADSDQGVRFPDLCGRGPVRDPKPELVRARSGFVRPPAVPLETVPDATLYQSVARYASTARAEAWLGDLAEAVTRCPVRETGNGGRTLYRLLDAPPLADQTLVVEQRVRAFDAAKDAYSDNYATVYTVAIRHGDSITVLYTEPYEDFGFTGPERVTQLAFLAADRLAEWRGVVAGS
jgi:hypothetical protein